MHLAGFIVANPCEGPRFGRQTFEGVHHERRLQAGLIRPDAFPDSIDKHHAFSLDAGNHERPAEVGADDLERCVSLHDAHV